MSLWEIFGICCIAFLILEMFTPSMFFLNFALASILCAIISLYVKNPYVLVVIFFILSFVSFAFLRPIILNRFKKGTETGLKSKYLGQVAKVEETITDKSGVISIYGERWEARSEDDSTIEKGSEVEIVRNESIMMYVKPVV